LIIIFQSFSSKCYFLKRRRHSGICHSRKVSDWRMPSRWNTSHHW